MCGKQIILRIIPCYLLTTLLITTNCVTTPYQPLSKNGGYFDYRITQDIFTVSFRGNSETHEEMVKLYLLRRAAELTVEHDFKYFVVLSEKGRTRTGSIGYSGFRYPVISPGEAMQIRCFVERPSETDIVIDAAEFLRFNFPE